MLEAIATVRIGTLCTGAASDRVTKNFSWRETISLPKRSAHDILTHDWALEEGGTAVGLPRLAAGSSDGLALIL